MLDTKALAASTALIVKAHVTDALSPILSRLAELEAKASIAPEKGERGEAGERGPAGVVDMTAVEKMVADAIHALPVPEKGEPGDSVDMDEVKSVIADAVKAAVSALPAPKDGEPGKDGANGKDGVGMAGFVVNREGEAIATLTDGSLHNLGVIVGRDGRDGLAGRDGADGRDGRDVEDIQVLQDGRTIELAFTVGEVRSSFELELPEGPAGRDGVDAYAGEAKGLYDPEAEYRSLDVVSFNGSEWRAKKDNPGELPGAGWMLSANRGKRGEKGEAGPQGDDGVSIVAQYVRGNELVTTLSNGNEIKADLSALQRKSD